jgi:multidrug transporter EmrE-like cation transporter
MIFLLGLIIMEIVADVCAKQFGIGHRALWFVAALAGYVLANSSWLLYMKAENKLSVGANIFSVSTGIIAAIIGCWFYGEIMTARQIAGVVLGIVSLALLLF